MAAVAPPYAQNNPQIVSESIIASVLGEVTLGRTNVRCRSQGGPLGPIKTTVQRYLAWARDLPVPLLERRLCIIERVRDPIVRWRQPVRHVVHRPPPLWLTQDDLSADAPNNALVIDDEEVIVSPDLYPAFNAGLGVRFAEKQGHDWAAGRPEKLMGGLAIADFDRFESHPAVVTGLDPFI